MTDWRAVGYGFVVMLIAGVLATAASVVGHAAAGFVGGPLGSLFGGAGVFVVGLFLTFLFAVDSALAGAIGGVVGE
ncbi:hypothetical protein ACOZ35_06180 [Halorubrum xinjiangense]|uniref:hypothetical protein n=1 Tax=Halorubrum xinjiangense TaxID=261291 RepID=UPI003C6FC4AD